MLLAVDVGNTETVFGVFDGKELRDTWRVSTHADRTPDELALLLDGFLTSARESRSGRTCQRGRGRLGRTGRDGGHARDAWGTAF